MRSRISSTRPLRSVACAMEFLLAGKREQPLGQRCAAAGALHGAVQKPANFGVLPQPFREKVEVADHRHEEIVEVVCHTADELAEGLDFLRLKECRLSPLAARDFFSKFAVRLFKVGRSLGDQLLQLDRSSALRLEVRAGFILAFARAFCREHCRLKRHSPGEDVQERRRCAGG